MKYLLSITALVLLSAVGMATTIYVPDDYSTIQGAIDSASNNDTVIVRPGTYVECIDFLGKAILLQSEDGPEVTIIDGNQQGSVVLFINNETTTSVIDGFTIENGIGTLRPSWNRYYGGGIRCHESSPRIVNNIITDNSTMGGCGAGAGGGIFSWESSPEILNNTIVGNEGFNGGGISCTSGTPVITNNRIINNTSFIGGGIDTANTSSEIKYNIIKNNYATYCGGGIRTTDKVTGSIEYNVIDGNTAQTCGGGLYCEFDSYPRIANNLISRNIVTGIAGRGGGLEIAKRSTPLLDNNTIVANSVLGSSIYDNGGGGLVCWRDSSVVVVNTVFYNNEAIKGKEIWIRDAYPPGPGVVTISYSDVQGGLSSVLVDPNSTLNWGSGMIDADPLFVDSANNDFHLTWNSPCRNTGDNTNVTEPTDFEDDPRIAFGTVDMGADEYYYHLYQSGDVVPGANIDIKVVGYPLAPVELAWGQNILDLPFQTQHGKLHIWPFVWSGFIGTVPSDGVLVMPTTIPLTWQTGDHAPLQALIGPWGGGWTKLTNLMDLTVE